ncbi:hypothetical protein WN73_23465 [Bradyrhizobium sp. CCBAU 45394]|nr:MULTISPECIES: hypothetical protein [unclassified Bradyrhizobium]MDA9393463.1 hypothetical protein [Bradyrhizobium sp. CCBAU 45394]MDA9538850.1 hypothetical protein [Bradyrhizobium sp. CCBAU 21362]
MDESYPLKITFREMRESGAREIPIYCRDYRCGHHVETNADGWADDVRLSDIGPRFVCERCGQRSAEVRPNFEPAKMGDNPG